MRKSNHSDSGHALIVVLVFLTLSAVLLSSAIQMLKQDNQSTREFENSNIPYKETAARWES